MAAPGRCLANGWSDPSKLGVMARPRRIWWATWPGALGMGLAAALLASAGIFTGLVGLTVPAASNAGTDLQPVDTPGWMVPVSIALVAGGVVLPVLTAWWAKRKWAGYLLLGLCLSALVGIVGLFQIGIL